MEQQYDDVCSCENDNCVIRAKVKATELAYKYQNSKNVKQDTNYKYQNSKNVKQDTNYKYQNSKNVKQDTNYINEYDHDVMNIFLALISLLLPILALFYLYLLVIKTCRKL